MITQGNARPFYILTQVKQELLLAPAAGLVAPGTRRPPHLDILTHSFILEGTYQGNRWHLAARALVLAVRRPSLPDLRRRFKASWGSAPGLSSRGPDENFLKSTLCLFVDITLQRTLTKAQKAGPDA